MITAQQKADVRRLFEKDCSPQVCDLVEASLEEIRLILLEPSSEPADDNDGEETEASHAYCGA